MANVFVNPGWNANDDPITVYVSGDSVYKSNPGGSSTAATCYSTFEEAVTGSSSGGTIYIYNSTASPLSLLAQSGEYHHQLLSEPFCIQKNLYVRAGTFQLERGGDSWLSFNIDGSYTVHFGVTDSFIVGAETTFNVWNGANFQLGSNTSDTSVSLENCGKVCVDGASFSAGTNSVVMVMNSGEIEVIGSSFSVASVTNTGTFKVEGTSKLEIGTLSGTITLAVIPANDNNPAVNPTLNASSITGGGTNGGTLTAQGDLTFTGANTLNDVTLNATGKTVTVGNSASLTVKGTSTLNIGTFSGTIKTDANELTTLNASSITGGSIYAQNDLTFTGANALNDITLDASGKTVTVGTAEGDSLTVGGTSTLNIGTLDGEIKTAASTTLQNSSITGGGANGGTITAQGAITVNNSTITSSKFTATTVNGVDFYGENMLDGVTLDTGVWGYVYIDTDGTLTIKGKSTLKTPSLQGSRTIKLDGAEIVDSWIGGHQTNGGTLVVESDKTATFSTTGSNSNDFGRTSINNSGTINVNGLLSLSTTTGTINNSGTINVNGRLTTGAITNTNGTIALNGGATVSSTISGGSITTSNTGTVTVQDSTISSSAFTATADEVIFYYRNTLNGITLDATGKTVTVNGILTVKGTSTLNATNITGGTISAQDNLTFTGTNTLNGVTLDATGMTTVTIGNDDAIADSLTVKGTNTLNIGTLVGTIKTDADALTTLNASNITGGSISAQNNLTFTGANTLNGVTLDAMVANKTVTIGTGEGDSLTVGGTNTLKIRTLDGTIKTAAGATLTGSTITGGGVNGGTITALGNLTFANNTHLRNITLDAQNQTVDTGSSYNLWLGGAITLKIGTLISSILLDEDTTFTNSTISNGNNSSRLFIYGGKVVTFAGANTIFDANVNATGYLENDGGSITVESKSNDDKGKLTVYWIKNSGDITVGSAGSANEAADACSLTATLLNNGGTITVNGENQNNRSLLDAAYITNGDNNNHTGMMSLTNSVLNATRLENYGRGEFDPGPPRTSQAAITISDSIVSITDSLTNGAANNTSATIEFNNSTVTADSVTNYGIDNGTGGNTGKTGFVVNNSTFTVNGTFTNLGKIDMTGVTLQAASVVTSDSIFRVYGTSTLDISSLTGNIETANSGFLKDSRISGGSNGGSISVLGTGSLTFTGANTLNSIMLDAYNDTVTIGNSDSLTMKGISSLRIASLDGTILTDSEAATTLNNSNITGGGTNGGTISARNSLTFTGTNTLNGVTLTATGKTITNGGTITANALSTVTASAVSGGVLNVTTDGLGTTLTDDLYIVVNGTITGVSELRLNTSTVLTPGSGDFIDVGETGYQITTLGGKGVFLLKKGDPSTLYVSNDYPTDMWTVTDDGHLVGYNAFSTIEAATASAGTNEIVVESGTYGTANKPVFNGIKTTIENGSFTTHVGAGVAVVSNDTSNLTQIGSSMERKDIDFTIKAGTFDKIVYGGDRLNGTSMVQRYGDITTTIEGGLFKYRVAGGMAYTLTNNNGNVKLFGDVTLNIQGGTFQDWIFGGCIAATKVNGSQATITGNVTVVIDSSTNSVSLASLAVGSQGPGGIGNGTNLQLTGLGANLTVSGEIWGGSSGDYYTVGSDREYVTNITGARVLSFTGFTGDLACSKIRGFDTLTCDKTSKVGINNSVSLSDVENWTFEYGTFTLDENTVASGLSGNFVNSFLGDTLTLKNVGSLESGSWTILENSRSGAFAGFGGEAGDMTVKFYLNAGDTTGTTMEWNTNGYYYADGGYKLSLNDTTNPTKMIFSIA